MHGCCGKALQVSPPPSPAQLMLQVWLRFAGVQGAVASLPGLPPRVLARLSRLLSMRCISSRPSGALSRALLRAIALALLLATDGGVFWGDSVPWLCV